MRSQKFHVCASISSICFFFLCANTILIFSWGSVRVCLSKVKLWQSTFIIYLSVWNAVHSYFELGPAGPINVSLVSRFVVAVVVVACVYGTIKTMISVILLSMCVASSVASISIAFFFEFHANHIRLNMLTNQIFDCIWMHYNPNPDVSIWHTNFDKIIGIERAIVRSNQIIVCVAYLFVNQQITVSLTSNFLFSMENWRKKRRATKYVVNTQLQLRRFMCVVVSICMHVFAR